MVLLCGLLDRRDVEDQFLVFLLQSGRECDNIGVWIRFYHWHFSLFSNLVLVLYVKGPSLCQLHSLVTVESESKLSDLTQLTSQKFIWNFALTNEFVHRKMNHCLTVFYFVFFRSCHHSH